MKKSLISTFIAAACLTASGVAMAADKEAVKAITVTTNVTKVSGITIDLTNNPETVTTDEVKTPGTLLTTL
ncbi:pilin, partial [Escherichia coli]|nr:pilin [Escherichia coli]EHK6188569.1 pilin [Escherichia coli]